MGIDLEQRNRALVVLGCSVSVLPVLARYHSGQDAVVDLDHS